MLQIAPEKVAHVIIRARELDAKVSPWDSSGDVRDADTILEARAGDATEGELRAFISALNEDEQTSLVALMWVGRETFGPDELEEAIDTARLEATSPTATYLLGEPLLADYLEDGLDALGISVEDAEAGIL
ncbi:DUF3775 domain-containing protein [Defluviimonas sp. WL0024]|uniref:DUF3775 domain-containing protein n=2 Tax=Albidovulum TaxID=205889 RepID=A0ABT3IYJ4_9RHOB|nr:MULTISPECIES: DUF3775 domain-containing protein [Defluviimonas]MCU9848536.1 DUF3775 domain-containing protein [Defluviimonas sp. WL0024]MCW3780480.1 DUF3775 domain-containing protein [Defluviimonas salinarum]